MIEYLLGGIVIAFLVVLIYGGVTGRIRGGRCCAPADPNKDLRTRDAVGEKGTTG